MNSFVLQANFKSVLVYIKRLSTHFWRLNSLSYFEFCNIASHNYRLCRVSYELYTQSIRPNLFFYFVMILAGALPVGCCLEGRLRR